MSFLSKFIKHNKIDSLNITEDMIYFNIKKGYQPTQEDLDIDARMSEAGYCMTLIEEPCSYLSSLIGYVMGKERTELHIYDDKEYFITYDTHRYVLPISFLIKNGLKKVRVDGYGIVSFDKPE